MKRTLALALVLTAACTVPASALDSGLAVHDTVVVREFQEERLESVDALVKVGVGLLAGVLFLVSILAYRRDGRRKFLIVSAAFMLFTVKGLLGLIDFFFPGDSPFLIPFSDAFDFAILLLLFIAVVKD